MYLLYLDTIIGDKGGKLFFIFFQMLLLQKKSMLLVAFQGRMSNVINRAAYIIFCKYYDYLYIYQPQSPLIKIDHLFFLLFILLHDALQARASDQDLLPFTPHEVVHNNHCQNNFSFAFKKNIHERSFNHLCHNR